MTIDTDKEWSAWRRQRVRENQRHRRSKLRRIDYQDVSEEAAQILDSEWHHSIGGDYSSILNRIVTEWAADRNIVAK